MNVFFHHLAHDLLNAIHLVAHVVRRQRELRRRAHCYVGARARHFGAAGLRPGCTMPASLPPAFAALSRLSASWLSGFDSAAGCGGVSATSRGGTDAAACGCCCCCAWVSVA